MMMVIVPSVARLLERDALGLWLWLWLCLLLLPLGIHGVFRHVRRRRRSGQRQGEHPAKLVVVLLQGERATQRGCT